jgi:DNA-binding PadR family transcriptional regulator
MSTEQLSPTARVLLGLLRYRPRTGYDIKSVIEVSTRFFWGASYGQIYPALKRLQRQGLVTSEERPRGGRRRTVYELTPKGAETFRAWLTDRERWTVEYRDEWLLRLFFGDLLPPEEALANVRAAQAVFAGLARQLREHSEPRARQGVEAGERFAPLALEFGLEFLEWAARWYARVERRLVAEQGAAGATSRQGRGRRRRREGTAARDRR